MDQSHMVSGSVPTDFAQGDQMDASPLPQSRSYQPARFHEDFDASQRGSSVVDGEASGLRRSDSAMSQSQTLTPSRGGTLKKKSSLKKSGSLRRSSSRRSIGAGSVRSLALGDREKYEGSDLYSAFFTPVPTKGNPTEILANRFQEWRKVLKDLTAYFREVQKSHDSRSKSLLSLSNIASNLGAPAGLLTEGGIGEATGILKQYHKQALQESNKSKAIEDDIIGQLNGLRSDLSQKIKEIKNLSGDFKNSVDKETEGTRKAVRGLQDALAHMDSDPGATSGKGDPYIVRLAVERQVERQIDEENYLHKAFLNLEHSGRELESIVVGEIQKAYNAYAGILKREADEAYETVETLRTGPVMMPKDNEWDAFVSNNEHFVDPRMPIRKPEFIHYPGKDAPAAAEVRAGMLERKSKYLKSYTPGWYVLSPTHLHEFKSADRLSSQQPVMSLYLQEQKLGSHSSGDSSSHKFMLKGRQTGGMHRGHGWVFRAESRDTMLAWYEDIKNLTEKTGYERDAFVRKHTRRVSAGSYTAGSVSSDGAMEEDEADQTPYSGTPAQLEPTSFQEKAPRPQPGSFPSDLNVNRHLQMPLSPSSGTSSDDRDAIAAAGALPGTAFPPGVSDEPIQPGEDFTGPDGAIRYTNYESSIYQPKEYPTYETKYPSHDLSANAGSQQTQSQDLQPISSAAPTKLDSPQHAANDDLALAAAGGAVAGVAGAAVYEHHKQEPQTTSLSAPNPAHEGPISPAELDSTEPASAPIIATAIAPKATKPEPLAASLATPTPPALEPGTPAATVTFLSDSIAEPDTAESLPGTLEHRGRPNMQAHRSVLTISDLHVPGEFPKGSLPGPSGGGAK